MRAYHETYGLPVLLTNCSNNYGPYQFPEKLIPLMILNALEGKPLPIYGDGGNVRDWLFVEDHCEGILLVLAQGRARREVQRRRRQRADEPRRSSTRCARRSSGAPGRGEPRPRGARASAATRGLKTLRRRTAPATTGATRSTPRRSARELGWAPRHDFEDGLRETVRWYLANRAWCEAVQSGSYRRERLGLSS